MFIFPIKDILKLDLIAASVMAMSRLWQGLPGLRHLRWGGVWLAIPAGKSTMDVIAGPVTYNRFDFFDINIIF